TELYERRGARERFVLAEAALDVLEWSYGDGSRTCPVRAVRYDRRIDAAIELAHRLVDAAAVDERSQPRRARRRQRRMRALVADPDAGAFTFQLTDEVPRIRDRRQAARRFSALVANANVTGLPLADRIALRVGAAAARIAPAAVVPLVVRRL